NTGDWEAWLKGAELAAEAGDMVTARFYLEMVSSKGTQDQRARAAEALGELEPSEHPAEALEGESPEL
ncbi:MAG TPA: hypothetical protein VEI97_01330, partial [bacterium]|nr:hypothetical protein [bacterium]